MTKNNRGNTIIEVMISILIIGTVLTAIAVSMTYSVKNTSEAQYRDVATSLASEPIEVLRYTRASSNWQTFYTALSAKAGSDKYITTTVFTGISGLSNIVSSVTINNVAYTRQVLVTLDRLSADKITVQSIVTWSRNGTQVSDVKLEQSFFNTQSR
jgi:Tfp pilus assembly protein PilV